MCAATCVLLVRALSSGLRDSHVSSKTVCRNFRVSGVGTFTFRTCCSLLVANYYLTRRCVGDVLHRTCLLLTQSGYWRPRVTRATSHGHLQLCSLNKARGGCRRCILKAAPSIPGLRAATKSPIVGTL